MARKTGSHAETTGPLVRQAALRLIARHGYAAVSMRQIAGAVGVRAGALYLYTPDKQTLLFDLLREHMEHVLKSWQDAKGGRTPPTSTNCKIQRIRACIRWYGNNRVLILLNKWCQNMIPNQATKTQLVIPTMWEEYN